MYIQHRNRGWRLRENDDEMLNFQFLHSLSSASYAEEREQIQKF